MINVSRCEKYERVFDATDLSYPEVKRPDLASTLDELNICAKVSIQQHQNGCFIRPAQHIYVIITSFYITERQT